MEKNGGVGCQVPDTQKKAGALLWQIGSQEKNARHPKSGKGIQICGAPLLLHRCDLEQCKEKNVK